MLRALGSDLDLRQALVDALNERVHSAQQIVEVRFSHLIDPNQSDAISFKPFGLDVSDDEIAHIVRDMFGTAPPEAVRIKLICGPLPCTDKGASRSLLVDLSGEGGRSVSYPTPLANPALRRSLFHATQQTAALLLQKVEPIIASIYDSTAPLQAVFRDEMRQDLERSEGEAIAARGTPGVDACLPDLQIGVSLLRRGLKLEGIAAERQAEKGSNPICKLLAETNIAFLLTRVALCGESSEVRKGAFYDAQNALIGLTDPVNGTINRAYKKAQAAIDRLLWDPGIISYRPFNCEVQQTG